MILIAPAFAQSNFGPRRGPGGGYRGLFGREISADRFVNLIVDNYQTLLRGVERRIYLYGHSAGGQFVSRYTLMHPDKIVAAVISAAGTFAFPNPNVKWTNALARKNNQIGTVKLKQPNSGSGSSDRSFAEKPGKVMEVVSGSRRKGGSGDRDRVALR